MLKISNITYSVEGRPLFDGASATIPDGHKVGLVGRNGTGKTTLFRLIRGELALEGGSLSLPSRAQIGGVAQEVPSNEVSLIDTVLAAHSERASLLEEAETATDPIRIADIQTRLSDIDAWSAEARAASILKGLGFDREKQAMPCSAFSGGWRMRVALAGVLFAQPDLLLLDEPTNYLDLEGAIWLESYAQSRLKAIARLEPITRPQEAALRRFSFPEPEELSPPILRVEDGIVGYDGTAVLSKLDLRIDQDDRIALLGQNGEGKSTLAKLVSDRLRPMAGRVVRSSKLRIGYFAQHQVDELHIDETPLDHIRRLRPSKTPAQLRAILGGFGIGAEQTETLVGRLSGGKRPAFHYFWRRWTRRIC